MRTHVVPRTAAALVAATGLLLGGATAAGAMTHTASAPTLHTAAAKPAMVPIEKNAFMPSALTVTVGQAVTWTNEDDVPHTVTTTSAPVKFDSGVFAKGKSFTYTFTQPGLYKYYCAVHPDMTGTVTVADKGAPAPKPDQDMPGMAHETGAAPAAAPPAAPATKPADDPISGAVNPFMAHMQSAHFSRGPGAQVQDIAEFDTWLKTHEALFRMMLDPEVGPSSALGQAPMAGVFMQHMDAAHWNRSPMEQASDISNFDTWNKSHLAMFRMMLDPFVGKNSALGAAPGTGVFMQHMDAAHWSKSVNGQVTDIVDDAPTWISSHQAMLQMMATSLASGGHSPGP
ncbi:MAG TPA: cupredoxin family copper-binding protein [Sporichthyaceae bacterium]